MISLHFVSQYFFALLAMLAPLAVVPLFVSMTASYEPEERLRTARVSCLTALCALVFFALTGKKVFDLFGISIGSFYLAGGLLVLLIGLGILLNSQDSEKKSESSVNREAKISKKPKHDIAVTPLGIPLIVGPGCITVTIAQQAKASNLMETLCGFVIIVAAVGVEYLLLSASARGAAKWLTPAVLNIGYKLSGLIVAALAVEMIVAGIKHPSIGLWLH